MKRSKFLQSLALLPIVGASLDTSAKGFSLTIKGEKRNPLHIWKPEDIQRGVFVVKDMFLTQPPMFGHMGTLIFQIGYCHFISTDRYIGAENTCDMYTLNALSDGFVHGNINQSIQESRAIGYTREQLINMFNKHGYRPALRQEVLLSINAMEKNFITQNEEKTDLDMATHH